MVIAFFFRAELRVAPREGGLGWSAPPFFWDVFLGKGSLQHLEICPGNNNSTNTCVSRLDFGSDFDDFNYKNQFDIRDVNIPPPWKVARAPAVLLLFVVVPSSPPRFFDSCSRIEPSPSVI